ncbi:hypothetical protein CK203_056080 [Vitis vinifera]|uniref:Reverse transcriptase Ty1/copia-type domain-containing protein n=1 Tax=Vitis vinifera TaxID=29760 RepID=A0A438H497_VITVI|nr:hypothetical protein CK203_056080 [Vitis vinifera]
MHSEFEMSMMGELNFFLGLQIKQLKEGTFINKAKYIRDLLKRFNMEESKTMKTPMCSSIKFDKNEKGKSIYSTMYRGMIGGGSQNEKVWKIEKVKTLIVLTKRSTGPRLVDWLWIGFLGRLEAKGFNCERLSLSTNHYSLASSSIWLLDESRLPLGHKASVQLSRLSRRLTKSTTHVFPYGRFLTRVFKNVDVDLIRETDFEALSTYDMYDDQSMVRMKFEKATDVGLSTQLSFIESSSRLAFTEPPHTEIPPP